MNIHEFFMPLLRVAGDFNSNTKAFYYGARRNHKSVDDLLPCWEWTQNDDDVPKKSLAAEFTT